MSQPVDVHSFVGQIEAASRSPPDATDNSQSGNSDAGDSEDG